LKQLLIVFFLFTVFTSIYSPAQDQDPSVGIVEKLGEKIPTDLTVYDENGNSHQLQSLLGKPTVLTLVYYRCPGICSPLLSSLLEVVQHTNLEPVSEYQILTISFDPTLPNRKKRIISEVSTILFPMKDGDSFQHRLKPLIRLPKQSALNTFVRERTISIPVFL